jgi:hypothetical protein
MKHGAFLLLLCLAFAAQPASATQTQPSRIGFAATSSGLGLEGEWTAPRSPLTLSARIGTVGFPYTGYPFAKLDLSGHWLSAWGTYNFIQGDPVSMGLVLGVSRNWFAANNVPIRNALRITLGYSFQNRWDAVWFRLTPSVSFSESSALFDFFDASLLGPSLAEVGVRIAPRAEVSLRLSVTPLAISILF